jgi:hypothetical protein
MSFTIVFITIPEANRKILFNKKKNLPKNKIKVHFEKLFKVKKLLPISFSNLVACHKGNDILPFGQVQAVPLLAAVELTQVKHWVALLQVTQGNWHAWHS